MIELIPLCTMLIELAPSMAVGEGPAGSRSIGEFLSASVDGERLKAKMAGAAGADWLVRTGTVAVVDARVTLRTEDDALIYMRYGGRLDLSNPAAGLTPYVAPVFETGDERYAWLNKIQAVGKGNLAMNASGGGRLEYQIFEIR